MVSLDDPSAKPLTKKLLNNNHIINQINDWINNENAIMLCICSTDIEVQLSNALHSRLIANPPQLTNLGTKHGSRSVFAEANIRKKKFLFLSIFF